MSRTPVIATALLVATTTTTARAQTTQPQALSGTIDGRPFIARSAVISHFDAPEVECAGKWPLGSGCDPALPEARNVRRTQIFIFDRFVGCNDRLSILDMTNGVELAPNDRVIKLDIGLGHAWPPPTTAFTTAYVSASDHVSVNFERVDGHGGGQGVMPQGTVQFPTPTSVFLDVTSAPHHIASGSVRGVIPITMCASRGLPRPSSPK